MGSLQGRVDRAPSVPPHTAEDLGVSNGDFRRRDSAMRGAQQSGALQASVWSPGSGLPAQEPASQGPAPAAALAGTPGSKQAGPSPANATAKSFSQAAQSHGHPDAAGHGLPIRLTPVPPSGPGARPPCSLDGRSGKPRAHPEAMALGSRTIAEPQCRWEQRLWYLLWSACPGVGVVRIAQLERQFHGLAVAWAAPPEVLVSRCGWSAPQLDAVETYRRCWGRDPLPRLVQRWRGGRGVLLPGDGRWPAALAELQRPPLWLHWRGRGSLWPLLARRQAIAVVGTRHPSGHGQRMAHRIGVQLASQGWPVISGLAEGIDAAAHGGCLSVGGAAIAVLGTPLQRVYPSHHRQLQSQVGRQGLLVSEWPADAQVRPGHFASRNRLLVALAAAPG